MMLAIFCFQHTLRETTLKQPSLIRVNAALWNDWTKLTHSFKIHYNFSQDPKTLNFATLEFEKAPSKVLLIPYMLPLSNINIEILETHLLKRKLETKH